MSGSFILDDMPNLSIVGQLPPNPGLGDMLYLAGSGTAGVLGRSLSLFSFLLQYESWPDPVNFKWVNLLLHLMNGGLLAVLCILIGKNQDSLSLKPVSLILIAFIWLAHPMQVSTVLYVVQRMTELSASFVLLGCVVYLWGRLKLLKGNIRSGVALMAVAPFLFGLLGLLSKENGVLIFPYLAVLELTLLSSPRLDDVLIKTRRYVVYVPLCVGALAFLVYLPSALQGYDVKPFDLQERLLTQFPVLLTYLAGFALLLPNYLGLFHDDFPLAISLFQPYWVPLSIVLCLALITLATVKRQSWPLFSFAVLWFVVGHALESTVLPLEIYFEHRNYLPLFGPVFALIVGLQNYMETAAPRVRVALLTGSSLFVFVMCLQTYQQSYLWGNSLAQAQHSVRQHPNSYRAQANLVQALSDSGQHQVAFQQHLHGMNANPPRIEQYARWLEFRCILPNIPLPEDSVLENQASNARQSYAVIGILNNLTFGIVQSRCPNGPTEQLQLVLQKLAENPAFEASKPDLLFLQSLFLARAGDFGGALPLANQSLSLRADVRVALYRVAWLIASGQMEMAKEELQRVEEVDARAIRLSADIGARFELLAVQLR